MNTPSPEDQLAEPLLAALTDGRPEVRKRIDELHSLLGELSELARSRFDIPAPASLQEKGAPAASIYRARLLLIHRTLVLRTTVLARESLQALNESRLHTFALTARAVMETAAAASYHAERLVQREVLPLEYADYLRAAGVGSRFDWARFLTDAGAREALLEEYEQTRDHARLRPPDSATNIMTMLEALARRLGATMQKPRGVVFTDYAMLSDMCHPSAGSHVLFMACSDPRLRADLTPMRTTVLAVAELLLPSVGYSLAIVVQVLEQLEEMDTLLRTARPLGDAPQETPDDHHA